MKVNTGSGVRLNKRVISVVYPGDVDSLLNIVIMWLGFVLVAFEANGQRTQ
jgi:hypothetical protein